METLILFLKELFDKEREAIFLEYDKSKIAEYNFLAEEINLNCLDYFETKLNKTIPFNLIGLLISPWFDKFYEKAKNKPYPNNRHLYKISEYNNEEYGKIWACYVSVANPIEGITKLLSNCFIVAKIDGDYKIVAKSVPDMDTDKWRHVGGNESINYYKLGKPIAIERIMSPENDEWSIEEYLKDR